MVRMARILYGWAVNMLGIFLATALNLVSYNGRFFTLVFAALALGAINVLIRPVVTILSLPAIVLTFGLFIFVVNALMLWLVDVVIPNFQTFGFWKTVFAALVVGIVNFVLHAFLRDITKEQMTRS
jgi:putative membrane protein